MESKPRKCGAFSMGSLVPGTRAEIYPLDPDRFLGAGDVLVLLLARLSPLLD